MLVQPRSASHCSLTITFIHSCTYRCTHLSPSQYPHTQAHMHTCFKSQSPGAYVQASTRTSNHHGLCYTKRGWRWQWVSEWVGFNVPINTQATCDSTIQLYQQRHLWGYRSRIQTLNLTLKQKLTLFFLNRNPFWKKPKPHPNIGQHRVIIIG